jgi:hypothetical protein
MANKQWLAENISQVRAYKRSWYHRNKEQARSQVKARKVQLREWIRSHKDKLSCACGENFWACLEFHHTDPSKKSGSIAQAATRGWSLARIEAELEKCTVMCANCHRKETHKDKE